MLKESIDAAIKQAMLARDKVRLTTLRSIKSQILLAETAEGASATALIPPAICKGERATATPSPNDVPSATPMLGVVKVGEFCTTNVVPVPVCEAMDVAVPTEVIGPVKFDVLAAKLPFNF